MPTTNREIFVSDPIKTNIPNLGVAKLKTARTPEEFEVLEWELSTFVCTGEYERGIEKVFEEFLSHLDQSAQIAAWVSGFRGSGKSHLVQVMQCLWSDTEMPSGASARGLAKVSKPIEKLLVELSTAGKRTGGLWSAVGALGKGDKRFRLAFLNIIFEAAGLPKNYSLARFVLYLKNEGLYDGVLKALAKEKKDFEKELRKIYVSKPLAEALIAAGATFGDTHSEISKALQKMFPLIENDITDDEMFDLFEEILCLQNSKGEGVPLTLIVLDELQAYLNEDKSKMDQVRILIEGCSNRFDRRVLIIGVGQQALGDTPALHWLQDRFGVSVYLSDQDADEVVRQVILKKQPKAIKEIEKLLEKASGEIRRELAGTKLEAKAADDPILVADYPLLPTRRRFWRDALRAIDTTGKSGVLRTQLRIVHEAAKSVAKLPLGHVIGADFMFTNQRPELRTSGALSAELDQRISELKDLPSDGGLKFRAAATVFLIGQLRREGKADTGLRSTAPFIADLLVDDLLANSEVLRRNVTRVLDELCDEQGLLTKIDDEFRIETEEGTEWRTEFDRQRSRALEDASLMASLRHEWLLKAVDEELSGFKYLDGASKTLRKADRCWDDTEPVSDNGSIPLWFRDGWGVSEDEALSSASSAGVESPVVFVQFPKLKADEIRTTLAEFKGAKLTIETRPEPQTAEGQEAKQGMRSRLASTEERLSNLFGEVVANARVMQGGGTDLEEPSFVGKIQEAVGNASKRMFPDFRDADNPNWPKVAEQARNGSANAISGLPWSGELVEQPVCKRVLAFTSVSGTKGSDIYREFSSSPYGWPKDAIDGALTLLLAREYLSAERDGKDRGVKELLQTQIGQTMFTQEVTPLTVSERTSLRTLMTETGVTYVSGKELLQTGELLKTLLNAAARNGGPEPLPDAPSVDRLLELQGMKGSDQGRAIASIAEELIQDYKNWVVVGKSRDARTVSWAILENLINHARLLAGALPISEQRDAISSGRLLLAEPDPVQPLVESASGLLRAALNAAFDGYSSAYDSALEALNASPEWKSIDSEIQRKCLESVGLLEAARPRVGTSEELLASLDAESLDDWSQRLQALPNKLVEARILASEKLGPKSVRLTPESATIKTAAEARSYAESLHDALMVHVDAGETVII